MLQRIAGIFWNRNEGRLRAGWRLLLFALILAVVTPFVQILLGWATEALLDALPSALALEISRAVDGLSVVLSITGGVAVAGRLVDRRGFVDFGFHLRREWWTDFGFGLALGGLLMAGIFAAEWVLGWVTVTDIWHSPGGLSFPVAILTPLFAFLFVGYYEELLVRGYLLRNLAEGLGFGPIASRWALVLAWLLTSALFGFLHAGNPNATFVSSFNIGLAGLFLGLGILLTGELAIPMGLHITWNFFQGNIFGFPVSGTRVGDATLLAIRQGGPAQWTGGAFGPEAGLIGLLAIGLGSVLTLLWVCWRTGQLRLHARFAEYRPRKEPTDPIH
ncbi:MAG: CPBP family intramembrane glutamic endopeptidase [Caldilineaceae bacterium]